MDDTSQEIEDYLGVTQMLKKPSREKDEIFGIVRQISPFLETAHEQKLQLAEWLRNNGYQNVKVYEYEGRERPEDFIERCATPSTKYVITTDIAVYGESAMSLCALKAWSDDKPYQLLCITLTPETPEVYVNFSWELLAIVSESRRRQRLKVIEGFKKHVQQMHEEKEVKVAECPDCNLCHP